MRRAALGLLLALSLPACGAGGAVSDAPPVRPGSDPPAPELGGPGSEPEPTTADAPTWLVDVEEVVFDAEGRTIAGTLTLPRGQGPFPAVLLIAGSGPTDRDWTSPLLPGGNGSAQLLAEGLSAEGVVVLRYDKAGTGSTAVPTPLAWSAYRAEQVAGLSLLAAHTQVAPAALFVVGHSEGGAHALRLVSDSPVPIAGIALLSATGRPLGDVMIDQVGDRLLEAGLAPWEADRATAKLDKAITSIADGASVDPTAVSDDPGLQMLVAALQAPANNPFSRELVAFDPVAAMAAVTQPVLVLCGGKDIQVKPHPDCDLLESAARAAELDVQRLDIADADHVLKHEPRPLSELSGATAVGYNADGRVLAAEVVPAVSRWVYAHIENL